MCKCEQCFSVLRLCNEQQLNRVLPPTYLGDGLLLESSTTTLALKSGGGDEALDFGHLGDGFAPLLDLAGMQLHSSAHIILLGEVVELADLAGTLWAAHFGLVVIRQSGNFLLPCIHTCPPLEILLLLDIVFDVW